MSAARREHPVVIAQFRRREAVWNALRLARSWGPLEYKQALHGARKILVIEGTAVSLEGQKR